MKAERGAILIQVSIAMIALLLFSAIVVDYGVLWASRGQAQTAADAGALGAALHLMNNPTADVDARLVARKTAGLNAIWAQQTAPANIDVDLPIACPPGAPPGTGCVKVTVYRGALGRGNGIPTMFAQLAGVNSQGVVATATAEITSGNAVQCIKPLTVPDKWIDNDEAPLGGWTQTDTFTPPADTYSNPGFTVQNDYGTELVLKTGSGNDWSAGWMQLLSFTNSGAASVLPDEIGGCPSWVPTVGIYDGTAPCNSDDDADPARGCIAVKNGNAQGPVVKQGLGDLVSLDSGAYWNGSAVAGGCMATTAGCRAINPAGLDLSPRIVPIAVFDPAAYFATGCSGSNCAIRVTNILGFFVEGTCEDVYGSTLPPYCGSNSDAKKRILGRIINYPGQFLGTAGPVISSFTQTVRLVR